MVYYAFLFPNINPIALSIGPVKLHWYGVGYVVGILFSWWYGKRLLNMPLLWKNGIAPINPEKFDDFVIWATIGIVGGGRLGEILFYEPGYYFRNPMQILAIWNGGMSFHGGFIGVIVAVLLFAASNRIDIWNLFDSVAAGVPIGLGVVRICNFINSELWGRITDVPWAFYFPNGGVDVAGELLARHPSQLYEAIFEGFVLFWGLALLIFYWRALKKPGFVAGSFTLGYGIIRSFTEFFREPSIAYVAGDWLTMGMVLSFPMIVIGSGIIIRAMYNNNRKEM